MAGEPHVNVFRMGDCLVCGGKDTWKVVAIPKLATGEQYPQFGLCEACGHQTDLKGLGPFTASATCPRCGMSTQHPDDIREGYCGNCHDWTREQP